MLSVPTLWIVFTSNFLAVALLWAYVLRAYPGFIAARFWTASAFVAAAGAGVGLLRLIVESRAPLFVGGLLMIFAVCLAAMGIRRFYGKPVSWLGTLLICTGSAIGLVFFSTVYDSMPLRIVVYSLGQALPTALTLHLLLSRRDRDGGPGARLAGYVAAAMLAVYALRSISTLLDLGGDVTLLYFNSFQAALVLVLGFLSMAWNFGFLLMAIDRLRAEVSDLALLDDLTGAANRRHLLRRLQEECALAQRTQKPFALLAIDLDGFKEINDGHGHAAGDNCLRHFTLMAQNNLRPGDLLARTGGDEFCVVLPTTSSQEGATIARRLLEACREDAAGCTGADIPVAASIGIAEWSPAFGDNLDLLVAAADQALYKAKNEGKNRYAVHDASPSLAPEMVAALSAISVPSNIRTSA